MKVRGELAPAARSGAVESITGMTRSLVGRVRRLLRHARKVVSHRGTRVHLRIEPPRPATAGWLLRLRLQNAGRVGTFEATVTAVEAAAPNWPTAPWILGWRREEPTSRISLEPGSAELIRLAIARSGRPDPDLVLLALDSELGQERRYPIIGRREITLTIRVRQCERDKIVAERTVHLSYEERDGELVPAVNFVPRSRSNSTTSNVPVPPEQVVSLPEPVARTGLPTVALSNSEAITEESHRFSEIDNCYLRDVGLGAVPYFRAQLAKQFDLTASIRHHLAGRERPIGLTLACGDMTGEYGLFKRAGIAEIDAWDISEGQREKFFQNVYDGLIPVNYQIQDVNRIQLEDGRYDVVYLQHAYHHVEQLEHVADEIRRSLKPGGILAIVDFVGANFLQRTQRQRDLCGAIWRTMPERYRIARSGKVVAELRIPRKDSLPPYEAIRSEEILSVLRSRFEEEEIFLYAGILFPLFNGFAQHYTDSPEDLEFVRIMWQLDRWLIETRNIEPNYMKAIFVPRAPKE